MNRNAILRRTGFLEGSQGAAFLGAPQSKVCNPQSVSLLHCSAWPSCRPADILSGAGSSVRCSMV